MKIANIFILSILSLILPQASDAKVFTLSEFLSQVNYDYNHKSKLCPGGVTPDWAKKVIAADLAEAFIQAKLNSRHPKNQFNSQHFPHLTVIDSGFDVWNQKKNLKVLSFNSTAASRESGKHYRDHDGHGTAVAGVIAAKKIGVTHFLNLKSVRVTPPHAGGSVKNRQLSQAIKKACETSDIVNVSWGGLVDELGFLNPEKSGWYKTARENGCLVFKSAGNSGYIHTYKKINLSNEIPLITVGSTNHQNQVSLFSTSGMIYAPGEDVFTLLSHQHSYSKETYRKQCQNFSIPFAPISGTSFSSPISSGVAAQVLTILKLNGTVPKEPINKISLIKRILKASSMLNDQGHFSFMRVNALAAVYIADQINPKTINLPEHELAKLITRHRLSSCEAFTCDIQNESNQVLNYCAQKYRHQIYTCPSHKIPPESYLSLLQIQQKLGEEKQNVYLSTLLPKDLRKGKTFNKEVIENLEEEWEANLKVVRGKKINEVDDFEEAIKLINLALKFDQTSFFTQLKLRQLLNVSQFTFLNANNVFSKQTTHSKSVKMFNSIIQFYQQLSHSESVNFLQSIKTKVTGRIFKNHGINELEAGVLSYLIREKEHLPLEQSKILQQKLKQILLSFKNNQLLNYKYQFVFIKNNFKFFDHLFSYFQLTCKEEFKPIFGYEDISVQFYCLYSDEISGPDRFRNSDSIHHKEGEMELALKSSIRNHIALTSNKKAEMVKPAEIDERFNLIKKELNSTYMFNLFNHPNLSGLEKANILKERLLADINLELPYNLFQLAETRASLLKDTTFISEYLAALVKDIKSKATDLKTYYTYDLSYFTNNIDRLIFSRFTLNRSIFSFDKTLSYNKDNLNKFAREMMSLYHQRQEINFLQAKADKFKNLNRWYINERNRLNLRYGVAGYEESVNKQKEAHSQMVLYRNKIDSLDSFKKLFLTTIEFYLSKKEELESANLLETYQTIFDPLKREFLQNPGKFSNGLKLKISRFYNLEEV